MTIHDVTELVTAVGVVLAVLKSYRNGSDIKEVKHQTDGLQVALTAGATALGRKQEQDDPGGNVVPPLKIG